MTSRKFLARFLFCGPKKTLSIIERLGRPQDKKNAFDRIAHAAAYWTDELHPDFQSQLDATKLEQQLIRSFGIRLTPPELGAVLTTIPQVVCNDPDKIRPGALSVFHQ